MRVYARWVQERMREEIVPYRGDVRGGHWLAVIFGPRARLYLLRWREAYACLCPAYELVVVDVNQLGAGY